MFVTLQYLLPHHLLCRVVYALTRARARWWKNALIAAFVRRYRPHLSEALEPETRCYDSFNAFFTRALKPEARPIDPRAQRVVSPCDGIVSAAGTLQDGRLLQAKDHSYSIDALLAGDASWSALLRGGSYATLYLAPRDYHRVHMPLAGRLRAAWHVPGRLFSVNAATTRRVPGLFARNERIVCAFDSDAGAFAVVLVGALFVGSMSTIWHDEITPWSARDNKNISDLRGIHLLNPSTTASLSQPRGAELGRFNMGSTAIVLLSPGLARWDEALRPGLAVKVGEALGSVTGIGPRIEVIAAEGPDLS